MGVVLEALICDLRRDWKRKLEIEMWGGLPATSFPWTREAGTKMAHSLLY